MNTDLFERASPSLTTTIQRWFEDNPGALRDGEAIKVEVLKYSSKPGVKVTIQFHTPTEMDAILDQNVGVLAKIHPVKNHTTHAQSSFRWNIPGIVDPILSIKDLVSYSETDLLRRRLMGVKALAWVKEALHKLDSRLFLGMIHKPSK